MCRTWPKAICETRRIKQGISLVHEQLSNGGGEELFTQAQDELPHRNGLVAPFARTDIRKYSFAVRTVE